jgi:hypothetical protein
MSDGKLILYVECLICRHVGEIPQANLDPDVLPVAHASVDTFQPGEAVPVVERPA